VEDPILVAGFHEVKLVQQSCWKSRLIHALPLDKQTTESLTIEIFESLNVCSIKDCLCRLWQNTRQLVHNLSCATCDTETSFRLFNSQSLRENYSSDMSHISRKFTLAFHASHNKLLVILEYFQKLAILGSEATSLSSDFSWFPRACLRLEVLGITNSLHSFHFTLCMWYDR
jgi:hypothetical protein